MDSNMPVTSILYGKSQHQSAPKPKRSVRRAGTRIFEALPSRQLEALTKTFPGLNELK